jgi:maltoporin
MSPALLLLFAAQAGAADVTLGSYGRVGAGGTVGPDGAAGAGQPVSVVSHSDRLQLDPYVELDVIFREETQDGAQFTAVFTPAIAGPLFHYDGQWDAQLAVRNLYAKAEGWSGAPLTAWVGSRMLRGDDLYLLNFWPMDNLNTVGAGLQLHPKGWGAEAHVGLTRLDDPLQTQVVGVPEVGSVGETPVTTLDRQRLVGTLKGGGELPLGELTLRLQGYLELHRLPEGTRLADERVKEALPADSGSVLGAQASLWGWGPDSFAHLWLRRGAGLAIPGNLMLPGTGLAADRTFAGAREHLIAAGGNTEGPGPYGLLWGGYLRAFRDADAQLTDFDDAVEGAVVLRPAYHFGKHASLAAELSHQWRQSPGLNPRTQEVGLPQVTKLAVLPTIQPHRSGLSRPQLRLQYVYSHLNNDARLLYPEQDARFASNHQHSVGFVAEWWMDSATYRPAGSQQ